MATESAPPNRLRMLMVDTNGNVIFRRTLDSTGNGPSIEKLIRTNDGNFLVTGSRLGLGPTLSVDMFALKFDFLGNVLWNNRYSGNPNCGGNNIEETPEGHYILSGNAGARIWRVEVDSAGNAVNDDFLYQTPTSIVFDERTTVMEHPYSRRILSGNIRSSTSKYYFAQHEKTSNLVHWGGEQVGGIQKPWINNDGSILQVRANGFYVLNRYNGDSTILWSIDWSGHLGAQNFFFNKLIYLPDSSGIILGKLGYIFTSAADEFYFCRISNVGVPYDPQNPNTAVKPKTKAESLVPYPNPVSSSLVFKGLKEEGYLRVYDLKGQVVKEQAIKPYQRVYLSNLPPGMYPYRIQSVRQVYIGKILKQ